MADQAAADARVRRRRKRRRKLIVGGLVAALLVAGAGTAWAMRGPDGPQYRLATVQRGDVRQTVDSDGTLAARKTATVSFASAGTVNSVRVGVGDRVSAGQALATIDDAALQEAVTSAKTTLAQAKQKLADDEEAQATGTTTTSSASTSGTSNWSGSVTTASASTSSAHAVLLAAVKPTTPSSSGSSLSEAQAAVVAAQQKLDTAIGQQDTYVKKLISACAASDAGSPTTTKVTVGADGDVSGTAGDNPAIVALLDASGNAVQTVRLVNGGAYSFSGLTAGDTYKVQITMSAVVNTASCTAAVQDVQAGQKDVDSTHDAVGAAIKTLTAAIAAMNTSGGNSGSGAGSGAGGSTGSTGRTGSAGTGSGGTRAGSSGTGSGTGAGSGSTSHGSGSGTGSTSQGTRSGGQSAIGSTNGSAGTSGGQTVTAEQIAADTKAIDAAKVEVQIAEQNLSNATLRSPIAGTVGSLGLTKGKTVSASSSSSAVTIVGTGTLSVSLSIGLSDIDLVKVGQTAQVTVDGRSDPVPAKVSYVGVLNSGSSTGTSSTYAVTVTLDKIDGSLYDGMGATVAIDVGKASGVLTVPLSAVHASGARHSVDVYSGGKAATKLVTVGVVGNDTVQVKAGVAAGDKVIIADIGASIPSSTSNITRRGSGGSLSGLTGGGAAGGGPRFGGGGGPGGR